MINSEILFMMEFLREAVNFLFHSVPLVEYVELRDQYLANVDLEHLEPFKKTESKRLSLSNLKDMVQLYFLLQSEYLRRLMLCMSCKVTREAVNLRIISDHIDATCLSVNLSYSKLTEALKYHKALGINNNHSPKQFKPTTFGIYNIEKIGRILQLCLLDIRLLEKNVESNENQKRCQTRDLSQLAPCLTTIRKQLNGCVGY